MLTVAYQARSEGVWYYSQHRINRTVNQSKEKAFHYCGNGWGWNSLLQDRWQFCYVECIYERAAHKFFIFGILCDLIQRNDSRFVSNLERVYPELMKSVRATIGRIYKRYLLLVSTSDTNRLSRITSRYNSDTQFKWFMVY